MSDHKHEHDAKRPDPATMTEAEYRDYMADPHAFHPEHHGAGEHAHDGEGHHVTSLFQLRAVLGILIFFTVLTVASSRAEIWVADTFDLYIPTLVNVLIAMSIATIKAVFVVAIFMHLKWDNRLNLLVLLFTLMGVGLFIGLTAMDLGNRKEFYDWKGDQIVAGGTGGSAGFVALTRSARGKDEPEVIPTSLVEHARNRAIQKYGEAVFAEKLAQKHGHHDPMPARTPNRSRATEGLTADLFDTTVPAGGDH
ncbi:MAG: cytochrome C oxidase subunit IV family protein [Phycisphaeraceae bacterium]|nr:cytochrome C oxidase subunit IV family protein [Phycisphaeraceae bacterium]